MKKVLFALLIFFISITNVLGLEIDTYSKNILLYNLTEDKYLYEKNSEEKTPIASLTKVMTSLVAIEYINDLDKKVIIKESDFNGLAEQNASVAGFNVDEVVTYRDLLYGLLLPSGADAALALVHNTYKTEEEFIKKMNELGNKIGLTNTHFATTTGLDNDDNYSTLKDLVKLLKYAIDNETFYKVFTTNTYTTSDSLLNFKSSIKRSTDKYKLNLDYIKGSKTGTTEDAGLCLISLAEYNNIKYISVSTKAPLSYTEPYHFLDAIKVYDYFFKNYDYVTVFKKGDTLLTLDAIKSLEKETKIIASDDIKIYMDKNINLDNLEYSYNSLETVSYKTKVGTKIGTLDIKYEDKVLDTIDIYLTNKIHFNYVIPSIILILILIIIRLKKLKVS